ncbi:outer membrane beta-barrel protein [Bacterioplanes sanyensis]|uniref:outer membrane beta-barrel protein n=1 Tax=Bacterioplanes sanyensis TaxID=1249553 RepID=UPI0016770615|nr:outer membrane beta-barrel protein [Bacterioplanes sanyensis]
MTSRLRTLLAAGCLLLSAQASAETGFYGDIAVGLGVQTIDRSQQEDEDRSALTDVAKAGGGVQITPFFSVGAALWLYGQGSKAGEDVAQFDGVSAGVEATAYLPLNVWLGDANGPVVGPYVRYGHHCWAASVVGIAKPWDDDGCSPLVAAGFSFRTARRAALYAEYSRTEFDEITSGSIIAGLKTRF